MDCMIVEALVDAIVRCPTESTTYLEGTRTSAKGQKEHRHCVCALGSGNYICDYDAGISATASVRQAGPGNTTTTRYDGELPRRRARGWITRALPRHSLHVNDPTGIIWLNKVSRDVEATQ